MAVNSEGLWWSRLFYGCLIIAILVSLLGFFGLKLLRFNYAYWRRNVRGYYISYPQMDRVYYRGERAKESLALVEMHLALGGWRHQLGSFHRGFVVTSRDTSADSIFWYGVKIVQQSPQPSGLRVIVYSHRKKEQTPPMSLRHASVLIGKLCRNQSSLELEFATFLTSEDGLVNACIRLLERIKTTSRLSSTQEGRAFARDLATAALSHSIRGTREHRELVDLQEYWGRTR
ncbi:MAG: hypothetical protein H6760_04775 [Candidatus Nomurabacteria bacterium]|nr:MAG: hypothetical protein H6760_04775 [Candidatus Nomurabacteria bacterium]